MTSACTAIELRLSEPPPVTARAVTAAEAPSATKLRLSAPRCCTVKPPLPHSGGCASERSPLTLTSWPGRTTRSVLMPASSTSIPT